MTQSNRLNFIRPSKNLEQTRFEGTYLNRDLKLDHHQIKITAHQAQQQFDLIYQIVLMHLSPIAQYQANQILHPLRQQEVDNFAQSIVAFYQDKDSYSLSLLHGSN
ncbi:hypothetical protein BFG52_06270 [Acinetobacter larvae]|uniref:Uncharacterized protein n=2 Tax=Acinetobacter larvae TaxID=1789224 RepID=A0A1B2LYZ0_9GAMM|nr:hypothetical protein BFG52_06270 [Acinetobacter larvae]